MMEDLDEHTHTPAAEPASPTDTDIGPRVAFTPREWVSPGVSMRKRVVTGIGIALVAALFTFIAWYENASMLVSTVIGAIFIAGFIGYLRVVSPAPFTLRLDERGITRANRGEESQLIPWGAIAKVKEELFKSGVSVSVTVYKRVGAKGLHRAWVVYRDDIPEFDAFVATLSSAMPEDRPWLRETIHE